MASALLSPPHQPHGASCPPSHGDAPRHGPLPASPESRSPVSPACPVAPALPPAPRVPRGRGHPKNQGFSMPALLLGAPSPPSSPSYLLALGAHHADLSGPALVGRERGGWHGAGWCWTLLPHSLPHKRSYSHHGPGGPACPGVPRHPSHPSGPGGQTGVTGATSQTPLPQQSPQGPRWAPEVPKPRRRGPSSCPDVPSAILTFSPSAPTAPGSPCVVGQRGGSVRGTPRTPSPAQDACTKPIWEPQHHSPPLRAAPSRPAAPQRTAERRGGW